MDTTRSRIKIIQGDITELAVDAIVNAANSRLIMGGGVAGAILRKGGDAIQDECDKIGFCPVGGAVITGSGSLKARYVIHTVGPRMGEGVEDNKLRNATRSSLKLATQHKLSSVAFPAVSTGIFSYPIDKCAYIMLAETISYLRSNPYPKEVVFCLYTDDAYQVFMKEMGSKV